MANMPGVGLEIFKAGGGWRDQKWAPPRSVERTLPDPGAGKTYAFHAEEGRGDCAFCLPNRVRECNFPCSLGRGEEIRVFHEKNREGGGDFAFSSI
ncbi:hypothetical protein T4C_2243 [Trichinella pseudospiralis]|uniref:Uncharacterized protein n=1 Tax=Trichinella pseudospiralis TaxID=6337 RepID=A0A0V1JYS2_TRIPS|nr:hypothetical protein T4C_2243 [Trichinella pseudospiralis]